MYLYLWTPADVIRAALAWTTLAVNTMLILPLHELMAIVACSYIIS